METQIIYKSLGGIKPKDQNTKHDSQNMLRSSMPEGGELHISIKDISNKLCQYQKHWLLGGWYHVKYISKR